MCITTIEPNLNHRKLQRIKQIPDSLQQTTRYITRTQLSNPFKEQLIESQEYTDNIHKANHSQLRTTNTQIIFPNHIV